MEEKLMTSDALLAEINRLEYIKMETHDLLTITEQEELFLQSLSECGNVENAVDFSINSSALKQYAKSIEHLKEQLEQLHKQLEVNQGLGCEMFYFK